MTLAPFDGIVAGIAVKLVMAGAAVDGVFAAAGIVKGLIARSKGSVVTPTDILMEIMPESSKLVAEVKVSPRDVGHVRVGQQAKVKITTYHVARFDAVDGKVTGSKTLSTYLLLPI